ncbi:MAG: macrocin O-methyltransferase [Verrucomicrobia bacterium]|nr:macrocin O-methyltransferase [Verrucomicrobiota bacterium]
MKGPSQTVRDLYLQLLLKSVSNLIYGSLPLDLWKDGLFGRNAPPGRDRQSPAHTMVGVLRLQNVIQLAQNTIDEGIPGHYIETGVWRGGCCILMRGVLAANCIQDRKVFVADSFEGLPTPDLKRFPQDADSTFHQDKKLAVSLEEVKENFSRYGLLDDQVVFIKGFFSQTLPHLEAGPFSLIRLDGDMYESTFIALSYLYPKLAQGGYVIIDDYVAVPQCAHAVQDYRRKMSITAPLQEVDWTAVYWRKP